MGLKIRMFCYSKNIAKLSNILGYSNDLNMYSNVKEKIHKQIQNMQSKPICLENILGEKYWCLSIKVMAEKMKASFIVARI